MEGEVADVVRHVALLSRPRARVAYRLIFISSAPSTAAMLAGLAERRDIL